MNNYRNNITKNNIALNNTIRQLLTEMDNLNSLPKVSNVVNTAFGPPQEIPPPDAPEGPGREYANPMPGTELSKEDGTVLVWNGQKWVVKSIWDGKIWTGKEWVSYGDWDGFTYDQNGHIKRWKKGKK